MLLIPALLRLRNSDPKSGLRPFRARFILWTSRVVCIAVALWWPAVWSDPIYTPRQMRLAGQQLQLPGGTAPETADDRAFAIFWNWERRTLVDTQWGIGPFRGLRDPQGRMQTLFVIVIVWGLGSAILFFSLRVTPDLQDLVPRKRRLTVWLTTPLWQFFGKKSGDRFRA